MRRAEWCVTAWSSHRSCPRHTASRMTTLTVSNKKAREMNNGSLSGLSLLERPQWSMVSAAPGEHATVCGPCCLLRHVDVYDHCSRQRPCHQMSLIPAVGWKAASAVVLFIDGCRFITENG